MSSFSSVISPLAIHSIYIAGILLISVLAFFKRSLSFSGAVAAFVTGSVLAISGGGIFLAALFSFFITSTLMTKYKHRDKAAIEKKLHDKTGTRDHVQVLANAGAALFIAVLHLIHPSETNVVALYAVFAACNADTWASEIGVLSKHKPFSILSLKPVDKGISGGVTVLGMLAALAGSLFIAVFYLVFRISRGDAGVTVENSLLILLCGFTGSLVDSILGSAVQPLYRNPETGLLTEKKMMDNVKTVKIKGSEFFSNDMVNLLSAAASALILFLIKLV